uniref:SAG-related sequence SRS10 n=1 Tax=Steinernema glaseri TaxID=37863 RepID=A0A1I7Y674_9BILA
MTEPAVFTLNNADKEILSKQEPIIEENEVEEDDSATHHFTTELDLRPVPTTHSDTTFCPTNPNRKSSGYSSRGSFRSDRRLSSCLSVAQNGCRKTSANGVRKTSELKTPLVIANGTPATVACNGSAQKEGDACSVTVYCVTQEMNV